MATSDSTFACPYCGHLISHRPDQAGGEVTCPSCQQSWRVPIVTHGENGPPLKLPSPAANSVGRNLASVSTTLFATLLGAAGGLSVFGWSPMILLAALLGFLVGRTIVTSIWPPAEGWGMPAWWPNAHCSLILAGGAWVVAVGLLGLAVQAGWFRGDGAGPLLMFIGLPVVSGCGLIGGPTASILARRAVHQIQEGQRPASDRRLVRIALILSRLMSLTLLGFLLWLMALFTL